MSRIEFEQTPNPDALRVLTDRVIAEGAPRQFDRSRPVADPLAAALLAIPQIARVMIGRDWITVVRADPECAWATLRPDVALTLADWLDRPVPAPARDDVSDTAAPRGAIEQQIEDVMDRWVRPRLAADGGDAVLVRFDPDDGTAWVRMEGACGGCPSGSMTLKRGIEQTVRHWVPEVTRVLEAAADPAEAIDPKARFRRWVAAKWGREAAR